MGDDYYTLGTPHPMIDGTLRKQRILVESRDPEVAILLLDFILGYNASMDPVGELLDAILEARQIARQAKEWGLGLIEVDGSRTIAQNAEIVARHFELVQKQQGERKNETNTHH